MTRGRLSPDDEAALWTAHVASPSVATRERIFSAYLPFARRIAARYRRGADLEFGDLCQHAALGLLEAIDRFDPNTGTPFRAYAVRRIAGSVIDGVGKTNELREQLSFRRRIRAERTRSILAANEPPVAPQDALQALVDAAVGLAMSFLLEDQGLAASPEAVDRSMNAYENVAWTETRKRLASALDHLPERERLILVQHYFSGLDFTSIATLLNVSKGRVAQLHKAALGRLQARLSPNKTFQPGGFGP